MFLETRRTIVAHRCRKEVTVKQRVVGTAEERHKIVLRLSVFGFVWFLLIWRNATIWAIISPIVLVMIMPEVLPFVTTHDIKVMFLVKVFEVLCIHAERKIAFEFFFPTIATKVEGGESRSWHAFVLLSLRNVGTKGKVQAQVFKAMNLIVDVSTTHERTTVSPFIVQSKTRNRVSRGIFVSCCSVSFVNISYSTSGFPLEITSIMLYSIIRIVVYTLRGVIAESVANSRIVRKIRLSVHTFGVEVHR